MENSRILIKDSEDDKYRSRRGTVKMTGWLNKSLAIVLILFYLKLYIIYVYKSLYRFSCAVDEIFPPGLTMFSPRAIE